MFSVVLADLEISRYEPDADDCFTVTNTANGKSVSLCSLLTLTGISLKENRDHWV
jgi:hypothetical protein